MLFSHMINGKSHIVNGIAIVSLMTLAGCSARHKTKPKPNVVVFMVDDMGWVDWQGTSHTGMVNSPRGHLHTGNLTEFGSTFYETPNMRR